MIQWMQRHKKYLVITIWISTIAFVGAGFVGWGAYDFAMGSSWVAKVGDNKIARDELEREYSRLFAIYNQLTGGKLGQKEAEALGLKDQALSNLIYTQLMLNFAQDLGLMVSDEKVANEIAKETQFYELGLFSPKKYRELLEQNNLRPRDYEESIRKSLLLSELEALLKIPPTSLELESVAAGLYAQDRLSLQVLEAHKAPIEIDKSELMQYWERNQQSYKGDVRYSFVIEAFNPRDISANDEQLQEYYERFITNYGAPSKGFADSKAQVLKDYQKAESEKLALRRYLDYKKQANPENIEELTLSEAEIVDKFGDEVFDALATLKPNDALKPIFVENYKAANAGDKPDSKSRYITMRLTAVHQAQPLSFEEASARVSDDVLKQKREENLRKSATNALENFSGQDVGFVSRDDASKLNMLAGEEAAEFLTQLFGKTKPKDYMILNEKAVLYNITEQKLFDTQNLGDKKDFVEENVTQLKDRLLESAFINYLQKRYTVIRAD